MTATEFLEGLAATLPVLDMALGAVTCEASGDTITFQLADGDQMRLRAHRIVAPHNRCGVCFAARDRCQCPDFHRQRAAELEAAYRALPGAAPENG